MVEQPDMPEVHWSPYHGAPVWHDGEGYVTVDVARGKLIRLKTGRPGDGAVELTAFTIDGYVVGRPGKAGGLVIDWDDHVHPTRDGAVTEAKGANEETPGLEWGVYELRASSTPETAEVAW